MCQSLVLPRPVRILFFQDFLLYIAYFPLFILVSVRGRPQSYLLCIDSIPTTAAEVEEAFPPRSRIVPPCQIIRSSQELSMSDTTDLFFRT